MSRVLKREAVKSLSGHTYALRMISVRVKPWGLGEKDYSSLRLTIDSVDATTNYWDIPMSVPMMDGIISTYCRVWDSHIEIPYTTVKSFLDSYREGLFSCEKVEV